MKDVVVSGAGGRLGRQVLAELIEAPDLSISGALVRPGSAAEGTEVSVLAGLSERTGLQATSDVTVIRAESVLLEIATRSAAIAHGRLAAAAGAPILIATTGFSGKEKDELRAFAKDVPLLIAPNLSLGVTVLDALVAQASKALADYDLEVLELHHNQKKDAPSGTAWKLARTAAEARGQDLQRDAILARAGQTGARGKSEIGMQSIRGGDIIGEHTVYFVGPTERIELTHRAATRAAFAAGAVAAARFLAKDGRVAGLYSMRDVLGLSV